MVTFEILARELRQNIYQLAFETAVAEDIQLNHFLRKCIRSYEGEGRLRADWIPDFIQDILGPSPLDEDEWHPTVFIPSIHKTAASLHAVFPHLADEINFVLEKTIDAFAVEENITLKAAQSEARKWFDVEDAVSYYGACAEERGELYDLERFPYDITVIAGYQIAGTLTEVQARMHHRFKLVVNRMYRTGIWP